MRTAIGTTGTIEQNGRIVIDEIFSVNAPTSVRVIVLFSEGEELNEREFPFDDLAANQVRPSCFLV